MYDKVRWGDVLIMKSLFTLRVLLTDPILHMTLDDRGPNSESSNEGWKIKNSYCTVRTITQGQRDVLKQRSNRYIDPLKRF